MHALAMADDANREPGAPIGKDEIDPDLIRLPRGALQIGLIAAAGVLVLCIALLVRLRHDVGYAREDDTPRPVTAADIVAGKVADNSYVTLEAPPDRAGAVRLRLTKGSDGHRVVAVRGTGDRLWLALPGDAMDHAAQRDDRVSGRLRRLADVRYAGPLARALAAYPAPRFITGAELRRARTANATSVTLIDGQPLTLGADADVDLSVVDPNAAIVVAALSEGHPTAAAWAEALVAAGVIAAGQAPISATADLVRWRCAAPTPSPRCRRSSTRPSSAARAPTRRRPTCARGSARWRSPTPASPARPASSRGRRSTSPRCGRRGRCRPARGWCSPTSAPATTGTCRRSSSGSC